MAITGPVIAWMVWGRGNGFSCFWAQLTAVPVLSTDSVVLRDEFVRLVLERTKAALMDAEELKSYGEKLEGFEPSAHMPDRVSLLEANDYDAEYRTMEEYLNQRPDVAPRDVEERYPWGVGKIDIKDSGGAIFNLVNDTGVHIRIILLRKPLSLSVLVHELLHIFEEYLNLPFGELARFSQSIADHMNIKTV